MVVDFSLLLATIFISFSQGTLACDRILSNEVVGPMTSILGSLECRDYSFFLHRETCLMGNKFESSWDVKVHNWYGNCPIDYSVVNTCDGNCGDGLSFLGNFEIECPLGIILCPFQYTVYDCRAEWEWREENSCDGGRPVKVRRRICVDCKGDVVDEELCRLTNGSVTMEEREICPTDKRYHTEWEISECKFNHPKCYPEQNFTRKCINDTWSLEGSPCDKENLEVTLPCQLEYDCCNCKNRTQCQECTDEYLIGLPTEPTPNTTTSQVTTVEATTKPLNRSDTGGNFEISVEGVSGALETEAMIGIISGPAVLFVAMVIGTIYLYHRRKRLKQKIEDKASVHSTVLSEPIA